MQKPDFSAALDQIVVADSRYARDAYNFVRESLDFTIKQRKKAKELSQHVTGRQLLDGIRVYALKQFGPMVPTVFEYWGVKQCEDFGAMVFNLIGVGIFGKNDRDSVEDFKGGYTFHEAFVVPYLPDVPPPHPRLLLGSPASEWT